MHRLPLDSFVAIVMGPSGVGKNTIIDEMLKIHSLPHLRVNKSMVTRERRPDEKGGAYIFVDEAEFQKAEADGKFIQVQEIYDHWYGTLWPENVAEDTVELFNLIAEGAKGVKAKFPNAKTYLLEPPSLSELRRRLEGRGVTDLSDLEQREHAAKAELEAGREIADHRIINHTDKQSETARELHDLIKAEWQQYFKKPA